LSIDVQRFNVSTANRTSSCPFPAFFYLFLTFVFSHEIFTPKDKKIILILKSDLDVIDVKFNMAYYNVRVTTKHTTNEYKKIF